MNRVNESGGWMRRCVFHIVKIDFLRATDKIWRTVKYWAETIRISNISIVLTISSAAYTHSPILDICTCVSIYLSRDTMWLSLLSFWFSFDLKLCNFWLALFFVTSFALLSYSIVCAANWISDKLSFTAAATAVRLLALNMSLCLSFLLLFHLVRRSHSCHSIYSRHVAHTV